MHVIEPSGRTLSAETPSPLIGYFADPNLFVYDGRYWLYATTDGTPDWSADEFRAFSSADLVSWEDHGVIFRLSDSGWAKAHAWAPGHAARAGRHYLFYTAERGNIGVAVADSPRGPYTDLGRPLVSEGDFAGVAIDPAVFVDDDDGAYLWWGNGVAHCVRLNEDMMSFDPAAVVSTEPQDFREAAWVHHHSGTYFLSWSAGDTREDDYRVLYATGATPVGPWKFRGRLLEKRPERGIRATGHHSIVQVPGRDEWIIAYHRFAIDGGDGYHREVRFDRLHHTEDAGLRAVEPAAEPLHLPLTDALTRHQ